MKSKYFAIITLFFIPLYLIAQENSNDRYLFEKFENGRAFFKNGSASHSIFNYDLVDQKILFKDNNEILELADPSSIIYINIDGRTFEHIKNETFYEKISYDKTDLYINWKSTKISEGKNAGYGGKSQTSSVANITRVNREGGTHKLKSGEEFNLQSNNTFYLKIDHKLKRFDSLNSFAKLFKRYEEQIKAGLKNENLDFRNIEDVKKAVQYCQQYVK